MFSGRGSVESLSHNHDVLALAFAPNGKQLAAATLNGDITLWNPHDAELLVGVLGVFVSMCLCVSDRDVSKCVYVLPHTEWRLTLWNPHGAE